MIAFILIVFVVVVVFLGIPTYLSYKEEQERKRDRWIRQVQENEQTKGRG